MSPIAPRPDAAAASAAAGLHAGAHATRAAGAGQPGDAALADAATRFEALILGEMLRAMRKATTGGGLARAQAEAMFRELQERIWAEGLARAAPIGLVARLAAAQAAAPAAAPVPADPARGAAQ